MLSTKVYSCPRYEKKIKLISKLIKHINAYTNQIIQHIFPICIYPKQDILRLRKHNNVLGYFEPHKNEKYILDKQDIKKDHKNLISKNLDTKSHAKNNLLEYNPQNKFFSSELLSIIDQLNKK